DRKRFLFELPCSERVRGVLWAATEWAREDRYETISEMCEALDRALVETGISRASARSHGETSTELFRTEAMIWHAPGPEAIAGPGALDEAPSWWAVRQEADRGESKLVFSRSPGGRWPADETSLGTPIALLLAGRPHV